VRSARQCYPGRAASSRSRLKPIHLVCRSAGSCQVAAASSGEVRCDSRRSPLAAMPGEQPVIDPNITFDAICSKSAAKILALVAMVIDGGLGVNSSPHGLADPRFPSCRTRAERASNEALRACARQERTTIKPFKLDKDFRHRRGSGKRARYVGSWNVPVKQLATARAPTRIEEPPWVASGHSATPEQTETSRR
jgi:hypothetical protein